MTTEESRKNEFAQHYKQLELNDRAGWEDARSSYRKLVHLWHPDKFAERPQEKAQAQQRFIDLTKSYDALRTFYRRHDRLPFQSEHTAGRTKNASSGASDHVHAAHSPTGAANATVDAGVLRRDPHNRQRNENKGKSARKIAWTLLGGSIMVGTIMFFLIVDRNANRAMAEKGRAIVKEAPISEFMPSATEIRRSQTRGAFIKPTQ